MTHNAGHRLTLLTGVALVRYIYIVVVTPVGGHQPESGTTHGDTQTLRSSGVLGQSAAVSNEVKLDSTPNANCASTLMHLQCRGLTVMQ